MYSDGQWNKIEFSLIDYYFNDQMLVIHQSDLGLGRYTENYFAEMSNTMIHRFRNGAQIIFIIYKKQKMISKRKENP
jgi:hypothetical protein